MKPLKIALVIAVLLLGVMADTASAYGRRYSHSSIGLYIGVPLGYWGGWYYPYHYPPYYYPPPVVVNTPPPVYIERSDRGGDAPGSVDYYWYRCDNPSGYWPYVRQCPGGWEKVVPSPPPR